MKPEYIRDQLGDIRALAADMPERDRLNGRALVALVSKPVLPIVDRRELLTGEQDCPHHVRLPVGQRLAWLAERFHDLRIAYFERADQRRAVDVHLVV